MNFTNQVQKYNDGNFRVIRRTKRSYEFRVMRGLEVSCYAGDMKTRDTKKRYRSAML